MPRRTAGAALAAAALLAAVPASFASPVENPRAVCPDSKRVNDIDGDAKVNYNSVNPTVAVNAPNAESNKALDITSVSFRMMSDELQTYIHVTDLPVKMGDTETAYGYELTFDIGQKSFKLVQVMVNTAVQHVQRPDQGGTFPKGNGGAKGGTLNQPVASITGDFDIPGDYVILHVPRSSLESIIAEPIVEGTAVTAITARSTLYIGNGQTVKPFPADSTTVPAEQAVYTVGNDYCFGPPPATLSGLVAPKVQYGDAVVLSATLADESGAKLAGKDVQFTVAGEPKTLVGKTGADGVAKVTYVPTRAAGKAAVTAAFRGDPAVGAAKLAGTIDVVSEVTKFNALQVARPSATTRVVTATLLDDDRHPVVGQRVDWYVAGKKVAGVATDRNGRSVFKGAKPGQSVQARFAGLAGRYAASSSATVAKA